MIKPTATIKITVDACFECPFYIKEWPTYRGCGKVDKPIPDVLAGIPAFCPYKD